LILETLRASACADCGERDLEVLEFDHLRDKEANVAALVGSRYRLDRVRAEIEKCEVVCANCHRHRTGRRAGWRRADPNWRGTLDGLEAAVRRNVRFIYGTLEASTCADCGQREIVALDFDHIGTKRAAVTNLAWSGASLKRVIAEIAQCQVRCANCHRRRTFSTRGSYRTGAAPPRA
jgi:hypothetical protein